MNPQFPVAVTAGQWNKVAGGVTTGRIYRHRSAGQFLQTFRLANNSAPTEFTEGEPAFTDNHDWEDIRHSEPIDVYLWPMEDAELRVDL